MIAATSAAQAEAFARRAVPAPERVRDGVWAIGVPNDGRLTTLCYLIEDDTGALHILDPGIASPGNLELLEAGIKQLGLTDRPVASIIASHLHTDHLGLAEELRSRTGAPIVLHRLEQEALDRGRILMGDQLGIWGVPEQRMAELRAIDAVRADHPKLVGDTLVDDGDLLPIPGRSARVLWTPGHTHGHVCVRLEDAGLLFTGDHVLPALNPGLGLGGPAPTNPIAEYLVALERVAVFHDDEIAPGHGFRFTGLAERCAELAAHIGVRADRVAAELARGPQSMPIWELASRVPWSSGFESLTGTSLANALAQTVMYLDYLRVRDESPLVSPPAAS